MVLHFRTIHEPTKNGLKCDSFSENVVHFRCVASTKHASLQYYLHFYFFNAFSLSFPSSTFCLNIVASLSSVVFFQFFNKLPRFPKRFMSINNNLCRCIYIQYSVINLDKMMILMATAFPFYPHALQAIGLIWISIVFYMFECATLSLKIHGQNIKFALFTRNNKSKSLEGFIRVQFCRCTNNVQ